MLSLNLYLSSSYRYEKSSLTTIEQIKSQITQMLFKSPKKLSVFNAIMFYVNCYGVNAAPSQETIAKRAGCGVWWVNRVLKEFVEHGWIIMKYNHRHTSNYKLNHIFRDALVRWNLKDFISSCKWSHMYKFLINLGTKKDPRPISKEIYINNKYHKNFQKTGEYAMENRQATAIELKKICENAKKNIQATAEYNKMIKEKIIEAQNEETFIKTYLFEENARKNPANIFAQYLLKGQSNG